MSDLHRAVCAISATIFAVVLLVSIIVLGGHAARSIALLAAFLGVISQFLAQDDRDGVKRVHIAVSYIGFFAVLLALLVFVAGW